MGTSAFIARPTGRGRDHPHAYGDKGIRVIEGKKGKGSSPRVWGQVEQSQYYTTQARIIPTRMGTRNAFLSINGVSRDHPHAYGDKLVLIYGISLIIGSSPRVWGQEHSASDAIGDSGIIPTRMGTSGLYTVVVTTKEDHPHAYGDKLTPSSVICFKLGSSPRVWGQDKP